MGQRRWATGARAEVAEGCITFRVHPGVFQAFQAQGYNAPGSRKSGASSLGSGGHAGPSARQLAGRAADIGGTVVGCEHNWDTTLQSSVSMAEPQLECRGTGKRETGIIHPIALPYHKVFETKPIDTVTREREWQEAAQKH